jgi:hypothetical protein
MLEEKGLLKRSRKMPNYRKLTYLAMASMMKQSSGLQKH